MRKKGLQIYVDDACEYRWRIVASNGNILADSGEGYKTRTGTLKGITALQKAMSKLTLEQIRIEADKCMGFSAPVQKTARKKRG